MLLIYVLNVFGFIHTGIISRIALIPDKNYGFPIFCAGFHVKSRYLCNIGVYFLGQWNFLGDRLT